LDWLLTASPEEIHDVAEAEGNDDPHTGAVYQADESLAATYFLRMFSMFEMAIKSDWRSLPGKVRGIDIIDAIEDVGSYLHIPSDYIEQAQRIRILRNDVIHDWNRAQVTTVDLPGEMNRLIEFLDKLPSGWP
jgi:hypothetical protein